MGDVSTPRFRVIAASVQGTSHLRAALPCQDAYAFVETACGDLIVAVADGAGSAAFSAEGARLAVTTAVEQIQQTLARYQPTSPRAWQVTVQSAFLAAQQKLYQRASDDASDPRHFAATLVLLILRKEQAICGLVGDCGAILRHANQTLLSPCPPQRGEYANTTNFIVQPDLFSRLDIQQVAQPITAAALFSDGLAPLAMNLAKNEPYTPFFEPLFGFLAAAKDAAAAVEQLADFLGSDRVNARTDDDKTLVLIQRLA
ncbi:MAG: protein phosphatase 2C domain-containing protein [Caldilineaceae bacterium]|nr:protein phosphatase 2C domain-containing protein [Caldilineaceae bacterium]